VHVAERKKEREAKREKGDPKEGLLKNVN